jgi:polyisoprenyl-phosphate glycosyltransferase
MGNPRDNGPVLSIVVPVYNEQAGLRAFHESLVAVMKKMAIAYEVVYCDDGSMDGSLTLLHDLANEYPEIHIACLSRNFGREIATTAGINMANGQAIIMVDADGQHPVTMIPKFVARWREGARVIVGVRRERKASLLKRVGSKLFYGLFSRLMGLKLNPNATDFRLIDRQVQLEFNRMTERNRIGRGLIDWLGYQQEYLLYDEKPRMAGEATQSFRKLFKLAIDSAISLSTSPLYLVAYIGMVILPISILLGLGMFINFCLGDPLHLHATGGAYMIVIILFLIGVLLVSQGIIGLYLSHIHTETQNRPLYVIDKVRSKGID